jgi:gliding motility associated protien GldN
MVERNDTFVPERLFWVPYDENLRKVLADAPFFNRKNSAARLSYDEVFLKRMFDSYIIREDNVFDRNINEYAKGVEALYESERIKQTIIDYEQSLWEY